MNWILITMGLLVLANAAPAISQAEPGPDVLKKSLVGRMAPGVQFVTVEGAWTSRLVVNEHAQRMAFETIRFRDAEIVGPNYVIYGWLCYEDVEGIGYLEMWSVFPDGNRYFTRTVAEDGPLQSLSGSSNWRRFELPFQYEEGGPSPTELVVNVVLPGKGKVAVAFLGLADGVPAPIVAPPAGSVFPWTLGDGYRPPPAEPGERAISSEEGGLHRPGIVDYFTGIFPYILFLLFGCGLAITFWLIRRSQPRLAVNGLRALLVCAACLLIAGIVVVRAYVVGLLSCALLGIVSGLLLLDVRRRRSRQAELRKMSAMDAG